MTSDTSSVESNSAEILTFILASQVGWFSHQPWLRCLGIVGAIVGKTGATNPLLVPVLRSIAPHLEAKDLQEGVLFSLLRLVQQVLEEDLFSEDKEVAVFAARVVLAGLKFTSLRMSTNWRRLFLKTTLKH